MKINKLLMLTAAFGFALILASCGSSEPEAKNEKQEETAPPNSDQNKEAKYKVDITKSLVKWKGYVLGIKEHTGTLKFKDGKLKVNGTNVISGGLQVDMTSMVATDANYNEKHTKEGLISHLSSPDFFDVANFPIASLIFNGEKGVTLSVRDKTHTEKVTDIKVKEVDGKKVFTGKLKFDRQKYGVAYTGSKDSVISDDIELEIELYTL